MSGSYIKTILTVEFCLISTESLFICRCSLVSVSSEKVHTYSGISRRRVSRRHLLLRSRIKLALPIRVDETQPILTWMWTTIISKDEIQTRLAKTRSKHSVQALRSEVAKNLVQIAQIESTAVKMDAKVVRARVKYNRASRYGNNVSEKLKVAFNFWLLSIDEHSS